jgi:hypothetical protein
MHRFSLVVVLAFAPGCLARQLRSPAENHHVQAQHIARSCAAGGYGMTCPPELVEDLDAMAEQACLLDAIAKGADGAACAAKGADQ